MTANVHRTKLRGALRALVAVAVLGALGGALGGCASGQEDEVQSAAQRFYDALSSKNGAVACTLLSEQTRSEVASVTQQSCADGILTMTSADVSGTPTVQAYGTSAQVQYGTDTAFLSRYGDAWLVVAAGCQPTQADQPYDCDISGG